MGPATFRGGIGTTYEDSEPDWSSTAPPSGAPNALVMLLDATGFGNLGCYGSTVETPNMDALAANGLRYNNFQTWLSWARALCSRALRVVEVRSPYRPACRAPR